MDAKVSAKINILAKVWLRKKMSLLEETTWTISHKTEEDDWWKNK